LPVQRKVRTICDGGVMPARNLLKASRSPSKLEAADALYRKRQ